MVEYRDTPITLEEIREKLIRHYSDDISQLSRSMIVTIVSSDYGKPGNVLFTIIGSPPKGYGIYVPEINELYLYNSRGKRWRIYARVEIPEIDRIITERKYRHGDFIVGGEVDKNLKSFQDYIPIESL